MSLLTSVLNHLIITAIFQTYTHAKTTSLSNIQIKDAWDWSKDAAGDVHNEHQLIRLRRSEVSKTIKSCYEKFFVSKKPPSGFRINHKNIRYICQQVPGNTAHFYSTMFDLNYGIPIYSAYVVTQAQASQFGTVKRTKDEWRQEPSGITHQASDNAYKGQTTYAKGHLLPAETYSFTNGHLDSTFTYTNAVPQKTKFNSGAWSQYERDIRTYASLTCSTNGGDLFLITGISEAHIEQDKAGALKATQKGLEFMKPKGDNIAIPRSMWTAGCCIHPTTGALGAFAVIGNNLFSKSAINMFQTTVPDLKRLLLTGVQGFGGPAIALFPGNPKCSDPSKDVNLRKRPAPGKATPPKKKPKKG
ncbi:endonuclease domain-containing 1 protein-like [Stylophora pistillata]|uniref:endonuclease domain-containing 1 protein-like n=1 Tax=Stylophora pistillata TaxID=50429 RepID=UPI000C052F7C|nr:endonuclease domain-containing 1 protein-like [Stylophora pistillata]